MIEKWPSGYDTYFSLDFGKTYSMHATRSLPDYVSIFAVHHKLVYVFT